MILYIMQIVGLVHNTIYNDAAHDALLFHWGKVLILRPPAKNIEHGNIYIYTQYSLCTSSID